MVAQEDSWVSVGGMNRLVRLPMCMQPLHGHTAWELSDLDHSHAATPQRVTRASCAQLLRSDLAPPAVDLLEALGRCVCTRRACCFCLRISHFCCFRWASSSGLARRRFPSLASSSWSKRFGVAHRHSHGSLLLRRLVCTRQACCLFARVSLLLLPLSFFLRVRVSSLPHGRFMNSQLLDVAHCPFSHQLLCFGFWLHWR